MTELISVIITIYNIEDYLPRAIESVINQTYNNLDIILIDDGATDSCPNICDRYAYEDGRIRVFHIENGGLANARNVGLELAMADLVAFVDGDDYIEPNMYEVLYNNLIEHKADIAICGYSKLGMEDCDYKGTGNITIFNKDEGLMAFLREDERYQIQNAMWNKLYRKSMMSDIQFPKGRHYEDIVYATIMMNRARRTLYIDKPLYNYITDRTDSIMNEKSWRRIFDDQIRAYRKKEKYLLDNASDVAVSLHRYYYYKRLMLYYLSISNEKPQGWRDYLEWISVLIRYDIEYEDNGYNSNIDYGNIAKYKQIYQKHGKRYWDSIYSCSIARISYISRMKLFLITPKLYVLANNINNRYIIPNRIRRSLISQKLIIIRLSGGLGNQMFQYALGLSLESLGRIVKYEDKEGFCNGTKREPSLSVFGIRYLKPSYFEYTSMLDAYMDLCSRIRRKLIGRKSNQYIEKSHNFDKHVLELKTAFLDGYWQSDKYFGVIEEQIRDVYDIGRVELGDVAKRYAAEISKTENSVGIHIRRSDYLLNESRYGHICTAKYYENAMNTIENIISKNSSKDYCTISAESVSNLVYYVFSDDKDWARSVYSQDNIVIVDCGEAARDIEDMALMAMCKHYIIANSSFSWWGSYLGRYENKITIAPDRWINDSDVTDIYRVDMIKVSSI